MICVPIVSGTTEAAVADIEKAGAYADLLEIRVDYIQNPDLVKIFAAKRVPFIITVAPRSDCGHFYGPEKDRIDLLKQAVALGADYIDVNSDCAGLPDLVGNRGDTKIIVSYHNFRETPADVEAVYSRLAATGADIVKIATFANRLSDNCGMLDLVRKSRGDIIAVCMGPLGEISRILAPLYGAYLTFGSMREGKESAPGQIPAEVLRNVYRINDVRPGFKLYGLIGNPVDKSRGYIIHNALFRQYGRNSIYLNFQVDDLDDFMTQLSGLLSGFSVTMPFKQQVLKYLDRVDPVAAEIGAVNTVLNRNGCLTGYNTDMTGALQAIQARARIRDSRVTILGAGGAARAIAVGVLKAGGKVAILNRTVARAVSLAQDLGCGAGALTEFEELDTDILINTTSAGMVPRTEETPVSAEHVRNMVVFDAVYNPPRTMLLREAEKNGCTVIEGTEMFINQAAEQFRLWTGVQADAGFLRDTL